MCVYIRAQSRQQQWGALHTAVADTVQRSPHTTDPSSCDKECYQHGRFISQQPHWLHSHRHCPTDKQFLLHWRWPAVVRTNPTDWIPRACYGSWVGPFPLFFGLLATSVCHQVRSTSPSLLFRPCAQSWLGLGLGKAPPVTVSLSGPGPALASYKYWSLLCRPPA